jgi:hypothetical protein
VRARDLAPREAPPRVLLRVLARREVAHRVVAPVARRWSAARNWMR